MQVRPTFQEILSDLEKIRKLKVTLIHSVKHSDSFGATEEIIVHTTHCDIGPSLKQMRGNGGRQFMIEPCDLDFVDQVGSSAVHKGHWKSKNLTVAIKRLSTRLEEIEVWLLSFFL